MLKLNLCVENSFRNGGRDYITMVTGFTCVMLLLSTQVV